MVGDCSFCAKLEDCPWSGCPSFKARSMTNQEAMIQLTLEEFYEKMDWLLHKYGTEYNSTRLAVIEWLKREAEE